MAKETELRRRIHSLNALDDAFNGHSVLESKRNSDGDGNHHSFPIPVEFQSDSDSGDPDFYGTPNVKESKVKEPILPPSPLSESSSYRRKSPEIPPRSSSIRSSWYEFDLSVVVALVSPIGNWLTGGDHVKNVLLLLLLIFYLHQIIEIPWALYNISRPRRPARPHIPDPSVAEDRYKAAASSELHLLELFFLTLTVISPLLGALILRYAAATLLGKDVVSWFSTSLFVLATGIRPWKHFVERFQQRITDLHDVIHYPPLSVSASEDAQAKMDILLRRMDEVEKTLNKVRGKVAGVTEEVYDYVDEAMDGVERAIRRHEKKCDATRASQELQLAAVEKSVDAWKRGKGAVMNGHFGSAQTQYAVPGSGLIHWLLSFIPFMSYLTSSSQPRTPRSPKSPSASMRSPKSSKHRQFHTPPRLETIPEDADFTYAGRSPPQSPIAATSPAPSRPAPILRIPGVNLALRCGDLATLPARAVVRYLLSTRIKPSTLSTP